MAKFRYSQKLYRLFILVSLEIIFLNDVTGQRNGDGSPLGQGCFIEFHNE